MKRTSVIAYSIIVFLVGVVMVSYVFAQTPDEPKYTQALQDLSAVYGQPVTQVDQAKAICNIERYLTDCAEIGKKYSLFSPEEAKKVDAVLNELKGKVVEDLKQCVDTACLVNVATQLAQKFATSNAKLGSELDLTARKVAEKKDMVDAAKEAGVDIATCQTIDLDTAPVETLRACAKLAKNKKVQPYISEQAKQDISTSDTSIQLREALSRGDYQCGDNTLGGCGNFCLKPSADSQAVGVSAIPAVCREIAGKFFGSDGVKQLESAYSQVQKTVDFYKRKADNVAFTTSDGRRLTDPALIGAYLEQEGQKGNVEAVGRGIDFMIAQGLVRPEDKSLALDMVQRVHDQGKQIDFGACQKDPKSCASFVADNNRTGFTAYTQIDSIVREEMAKHGVSDPALCSGDSQYAKLCVDGAQATLPRLEAIAQSSPEAARVVAQIKQNVLTNNQSFEARKRVEDQFTQKQGSFTIGDKTFQNFSELDAFCKDNGGLCLAEAAKRGVVEKGFAEQKYTQSFDAQYQYQRPGDFVSSQVRQDNNVPSGYPQGPSYPNYYPQGQNQSFGSIDKAAALKQFQAWLDNPQGPPPVPTAYPQRPADNTYPTSAQPYSYPQQLCPRIYFAQCPQGFYREETRSVSNACPSYGSCVPLPGFQDRPTSTTQTQTICPAIPTVDSCPAGQERYTTYSSSECGTYYSCRGNYPYPTPTSTQPYESCPAGQYRYWPPSGGASYCVSNTTCSSGQYWNGTSCVASTASTTYNTQQCSWSTEYLKSTTNQCLPRTNCSDRANPEYNSSECQGVRSTSQPPMIQGTCTQDLINLLGSGCHNMGNAWFNGPMTQYVFPGTTVLRDCSAGYTSGCTSGGTTYSSSTYTYTAGQRQQSWNSLGLNSSIRTDADSTRIEQLKQACINISSGNTIWMSGAGDPSSPDFGMPDPNKCRAAAACVSGQYWNGTSCVTAPTSGCPSGQTWNGTACVNSATTTSTSSAQSGCISAGGTWNTTSNYCQMPSSSCPLGQYWNGTSCVITTSTTSTNCQSGQYWNGSTCINSTTTTTSPSTSCGSNQWWDGSANVCRDNCPSGQYWSGSSCVSNTTTNGGSTTCPSGQYWNGTACQTTSSSNCPSGQMWNGSSCVPSSSGTSSAESGCLSAGGTWNATSNYCQMPSSSCPSNQYWNGTSCVTAPSSGCPSGQTWNGTACVTSRVDDGRQFALIVDGKCPAGHAWAGDHCVLRVSWTAHFLAQVGASLSQMVNGFLGLFR